MQTDKLKIQQIYKGSELSIHQEFLNNNLRFQKHHEILIKTLISGKHFYFIKNYYYISFLDWCNSKESTAEYILCVKIAFDLKKQIINTSFQDNSFVLSVNKLYSISTLENQDLNNKTLASLNKYKPDGRSYSQRYDSIYNGLAAELIFHRETGLSPRIYKYRDSNGLDGYSDIDAFNKQEQSINVKCIKPSDDLKLHYKYTKQVSMSDAYVMFQKETNGYRYLGWYTHRDVILSGSFNKIYYPSSKQTIHFIRPDPSTLRKDDSFKHFIL
jgi:hypothetical protein